MSLSKYIKAAFTNRWNLLGLAGGIGFSLLSGAPEIGLPLVAAAEIAWLGFVGTHPRFRQFVDVSEHRQLQQDDARTAEIRMRRMLTSLPRGAQRRFDVLMEQCEELRKITRQFQQAHGADTDEAIAEVRLEGLDRLLWLFLKLLYTENSLNRFFETTTIDQIEREIRQVKGRLNRENARPDQEQRSRIIATLQDNLKTCEQRKRNFEQARDSYELVKAEQRRLENKIRSLAELGISRGDPASLSSEVDTVAGSIHETEATLSELEFVTGFQTYEDEAVPEIVTRKVVTGE
ncbi:MAG: hypothetical protein NXI04_19880 [Planctomycetaceae bacterium]|nr:hypothetical protein [Planctomycetaceae bacterium]